MLARILAVCLWSLAAASLLLWHRQTPGLRASTQDQPAPALAQALAPPRHTADLSRFFGQAVSPSAAPSARTDPSPPDLRLTGVVARPADGSAGLALLTVEGQAPRAVRVGQEVTPGWRLLRVEGRMAQLGGPQQASIELRLPDPPLATDTPAAFGTAPMAGPFGMVPDMRPASGGPVPAGTWSPPPADAAATEVNRGLEATPGPAFGPIDARP